eukprot:2161935-Karenia_brevis.AAC.1
MMMMMMMMMMMIRNPALGSLKLIQLQRNRSLKGKLRKHALSAKALWRISYFLSLGGCMMMTMMTLTMIMAMAMTMVMTMDVVININITAAGAVDR